MFLDLRDSWPPEPWSPPPRPDPKLTPRQQKTMIWLVSMNVMLLFVAPICGATFFDAIATMFRH